MDDRSELSDHETDFTQRCDDFVATRNARLVEGLTMQSSVAQTQSNCHENKVCRSRSESILWSEDNGRLKLLGRSMKDSINLMIDSGTSKSLANIPNDKVLSCRQLFNNESCFLYNNGSSRGFLSKHTSLSLPALSTLPMNIVLAKDAFNESDYDIYKYKGATTCLDEGKTVFNRLSETKDFQLNSQGSANEDSINVCRNQLSEHEHDKDDFEKDITANDTPETEPSCKEIADSLSQSSNIIISDEKPHSPEIQHKENKLNFLPTVNNHVRSSLISRPTLAEDSKLVKMSLLANPMNIMQSNVQLLNRSRNFLNFITEKSTNIMEKALLPQHLAMRYNHVSKSVETDTTGALITTNASSLGDLTCKLNVASSINSNNTLNVASYTPKQDKDKNEDQHDGAARKEVDLLASTKENEIISNERKYYISKNNVDRLDSNATSGQLKWDFSIEADENKMNVLHMKKLHDDVYKTKSDIGTLSNSDISKYGSLEHPLHHMLLEDYANLRLKYLKLLEKTDTPDNSVPPDGESQRNSDAYSSQVGNLEKAVIKLTTDLNRSLATQEALKNECIAVNKEKENMVMKYVISEKQVIDSQRAKDSAERKAKELLKDQEALQCKLRQSQGERTRICNILDAKRREVTDHQKEIEKLKEDARMRDIQLKWAQNKLKTEMESQKDTQQKLDKALMKINDMKEECEQIRRETQESFRKFQQSEENKAVTLDHQLKEHQARLILERHVTEDKETLRLQLQKELDILKSKQQDLFEENKRLNSRVQESEKVRLEYEINLNDLKSVAKQRQEQITELLDKVADFEVLKLQLQCKEEYIVSTQIEIQQLRTSNEELLSDMQACREKEANMLDFTQKLTDKNVRLQSDFIAIQRKADFLETEHGPLRDCINELNSKVKGLERDLKEEQRKRREECEILAKHVAEQTQLAQNIAQKLEDSQGENAVLRRKHQISIKEMTRELQQCRKKLEIFEAASPSNSLDITSRTGSNTSLNTGETLNGALSDNNANGDHVQTVEPNKQLLMDHIIKLQEINAKRAEKLDFLEEHTKVLMGEVQKKTKIIQNYILQQNFGALGCNERDRNKAELARYGGIMASVYNHQVSDENMTLELSLEINQKLQAVLEDVLLKNITLKDNIDTLGKEIARLTMQLQQRRIEN